MEKWLIPTRGIRCLLRVVLDGVALVVNLSTLRKKAFATLATAIGENAASCLGGHAGTEAVLLFARALGGLVCTEAHDKLLVKNCVPVGARGRDFRGREPLVNAAVVNFKLLVPALDPFIFH
jgi:hypothetical protein